MSQAVAMPSAIVVGDDDLLRRALVAVPVDAADPLLEAVRVPGQPDVEREVGLLEVPADVAGVVDDQDPARRRASR